MTISAREQSQTATLVLSISFYGQNMHIMIVQATDIQIRALTTNFHILVSRGGGWLGISKQ